MAERRPTGGSSVPAPQAPRAAARRRRERRAAEATPTSDRTDALLVVLRCCERYDVSADEVAAFAQLLRCAASKTARAGSDLPDCPRTDAERLGDALAEEDDAEGMRVRGMGPDDRTRERNRLLRDKSVRALLRRAQSGERLSDLF